MIETSVAIPTYTHCNRPAKPHRVDGLGQGESYVYFDCPDCGAVTPDVVSPTLRFMVRK